MFEEANHKRRRYKESSCEVTTMICPFSWVEAIKPKEYFSLLFEEKAKTVTQPQPCLLSRCKFFNASKGICKLIADE